MQAKINRLPNFLIKHKFLTIIPIILIGLIIVWLLYILTLPKGKIYFKEDFTYGISKYRSLDAIWLQQDKDGTKHGIVLLSKKKYAAPYLQVTIPKTSIPEKEYVLHFRIKVSSFDNDALTLGAIFLPSMPIVVISNSNGQLGFSHDLFQKPVYASKLSTKLSRNKWHDIYIHVDPKRKQNILYLDYKKVLREEWDGMTFPLQEFWLGALWLGGNQNYGAPINVSYDEVSIGDKYILPKPSFLDFILFLLKMGRD